MRMIGAGIRGFWSAVAMGDPLWPAVTILLGSVVLAVVTAAVRFRRSRNG
ncbi:hypothetical protein [Streptomyces sp. CBMA123]|nr:hypothetical protein [Streptomyces sp. CBMA123]